jgi:hypothetical protein
MTPPQVQAEKERRRAERRVTVDSLFKGTVANLAVKKFSAVTAVAAVTADSAEIPVSVAS